MRYTVVYDQTERNFGAYIPHLPIVVITGRTLAELTTNAHEAILLHLRGTLAADESVEIDLVPASDYQGDIHTLEGKHLPAKRAVASPSA
jgi:predicted RNase H-like HicB family nuclease